MTVAADFELEVAAQAESVPLVRHALRGLLTSLAVDDVLSADIALAVTEACTNAVLHAYPTASGSIEVRALRAGDALDVCVRDHGAGMSPRMDSPGLGVGLPVIAAIADSVRIGSPDDGGTEVRMQFRLRPQPF